VKLFFDDAGFDGQLQRTVAKCDHGMANAGECLTIAAAIEPGDRDSWHQAFAGFGSDLRAKADAAERGGHSVTAGGYRLRATEYFRNASFFHRDDLDSDELQTAYRASRECFEAALPALPFEVSRFEVKGPDATYGGYLALPEPHPAEPLPAVIMPGGYDGTAEEGYPLLLEAARRGYAAYSFDGPGQGGTLYEQRVFMRPDWENVLPPVFEAIASLPQIDESRIALLGRSFGGYLAPRAASAEPRLAALIVDPGQYDIGGSLKGRLPPELIASIDEDSEEADAAFESLLEIEALRQLFRPRMTAHGSVTVREYLRSMLEYTNEGRAERIGCPTLVCDNETDLISTGQGELLFEHLRSPAEFVRFTAAEGAEGHCEGMAAVVFFARAFDWLDATLAG
jgi:pimeloyl-ACP methyl ester carboxylesterase